MFSKEENERVQKLLDSDKFFLLDDWRETGLPIVAKDFRDLMNGDPYLNSLHWRNNGLLHTGFSIEKIVELFKIKKEIRYDASQDRMLVPFCGGYGIHSIHSGVRGLYATEHIKDKSVHRGPEIEELLDLKPFKARIINPSATRPLNKNGWLKPLYNKIAEENSTFIIDSAVPKDDYAGQNKTGLILIINGIGNRSGK